MVAGAVEKIQQRGRGVKCNFLKRWLGQVLLISQYLSKDLKDLAKQGMRQLGIRDF